MDFRASDETKEFLYFQDEEFDMDWKMINVTVLNSQNKDGRELYDG